MNEDQIEDQKKKQDQDVFDRVMLLKAQHGLIWYHNAAGLGDKPRWIEHKLYPFDPLPQGFEPGNIPQFKIMSRRERRAKK